MLIQSVRSLSGNDRFRFDFELNIVAEEGLYASKSACGRVFRIDNPVASRSDCEELLVSKTDDIIVEFDEIGGFSLGCVQS